MPKINIDDPKNREVVKAVYFAAEIAGRPGISALAGLFEAEMANAGVSDETVNKIIDATISRYIARGAMIVLRDGGVEDVSEEDIRETVAAVLDEAEETANVNA